MNPNKLLQEIDMIQKAKAIVASKLSTLDQRLTEMEFSSDIKPITVWTTKNPTWKGKETEILSEYNKFNLLLKLGMAKYST